MKKCKTCGVPLRIGKGHVWDSSGTITQRSDPDHRMVFIESDSLDALFSNISKLIGMPIEKMVIEAKARATQSYISSMLHGARGAIARMIGINRIVKRIVEQGKVMGYGNINVTEYNWKESRMTCEIDDPYSLPMFCGDLKGANQAIRKVAGTISVEEIAPQKFRIENFNEPHAPELEERLYVKPPTRKPGNVVHTRCSTCEAPMQISHYKWDLERGTIYNQFTGLRMAIFGPFGLQAIFDELESELGSDIPATIVEAQRMHWETISSPVWKSLGEADLRSWLSVQGLGNLVELNVSEEGLSAVIENAALPLVIAGTALAVFEFYSGKKGAAEWEIKNDGDLVLKLKPAS